MINIDFNVEYYDYNCRDKNLNVEAKGKVKSEKFFPVFLKDGKEYIFKPLSKTKPLTTPFFAYSEVVWSNIINKYFDESAPIYRLAICNNYDENVPKYYNIGTIVPSVINDGEKIVNLLEYFNKNKDEEVNIDDYTNFCMKLYDYTCIFKSKLFSENKELGEALANQVLLSILRADQNFHYENVGFICKENEILRMQPPIDHEFSTMFLFLDDIEVQRESFKEFIEHLSMEEKELSRDQQIMLQILREENMLWLKNAVEANLDIIIERYPNVVETFIEKLQILINDLKENGINFENHNYIFPFNSDNYKAGMARYKNDNIEAAKIIMESLVQRELNLNLVSGTITDEIISLATLLKENLTKKIEEKNTNKRLKLVK